MAAALIIGIGHKKQQGKDSLATALMSEFHHLGHDPNTVPFSGPLKELCQAVFGLTWAQCNGTEEQKSSPTEVTLWDLGKAPFNTGSIDDPYLTGREVLQHVGVSMRNIFPGIWKNGPFLGQESGVADVIIIPDVRFDDEADKIKAEGGLLIRVIRPGLDAEDDLHESETALEGYNGWNVTVVNDSTLEDLQEVARRLAHLVLSGYLDREEELVVHSKAVESLDVGRSKHNRGRKLEHFGGKGGIAPSSMEATGGAVHEL